MIKHLIKFDFCIELLHAILYFFRIMPRRKLFTLLELMIVISIFLILISILKPSLRKVLSSSRLIQCSNNLSHVYTGLSLYMDDFDDSCPGPSWAGQEASIRGRRQLSEYINIYFEEKISDNGDNYLNEMLCPENFELDLNINPYRRTGFLASYIRGLGYPFGRPNFSLPKKVYEIPNLSQNTAMIEADFNNYPYIGINRISEFPMHFGIYRNSLYFDGHVDTIDFR